MLLQQIAWQLTDGVSSCTKTPSGPSRGVYLLKKRTSRCIFLHDYNQAACKNKHTTCGSPNHFAFYVCMYFFFSGFSCHLVFRCSAHLHSNWAAVWKLSRVVLERGPERNASTSMFKSTPFYLPQRLATLNLKELIFKGWSGWFIKFVARSKWVVQLSFQSMCRWALRAAKRKVWR